MTTTPTLLVHITSAEAPFLVGMKGRNVSLIRKCTGVLITIQENAVYVTNQRASSNPDLAARMVMSACCGGILRWFVTQSATASGYPAERAKEMEALALEHHCAIKLLRARSGHMCLMLIPDDPLARDSVAQARVALLDALPHPL